MRFSTIFRSLSLLLIAFVCVASVPAAEWTLNRPIAIADYGGNMIRILDADGQVEWEYEARRPQEVWVLANGNILFSHTHGAIEVTRDKEVVWSFEVPATSEIHACQPLPDGLVLIAESGPMQLLEVDRDGEIVKTVPLQTTIEKTHGQMRCVRKTSDGNYVVGQYTESVVRTYDADGKILSEIKHGHSFGGIPLPNGNLLCACGDAHRIVEINPDGETVWEVTENDLPGNPLRFMAGLQRLPNGNTLICNWGGHGHIGEQPQVVEITPEKEVVGVLYDFDRFSTIAGVCAIGVEGDPAQFEVLR